MGKTVNIKESLLRLDKSTDFAYDLLTAYEASDMGIKEKKKLAEMLSKNKKAEAVSKFLAESIGHMKDDHTFAPLSTATALEVGQKVYKPNSDEIWTVKSLYPKNWSVDIVFEDENGNEIHRSAGMNSLWELVGENDTSFEVDDDWDIEWHPISDYFDGNESLSEGLSPATPYMLRNDGEVLACGDIHPYIKQIFRSDADTVKFIVSHIDALKWFYDNTKNESTKEIIRTVAGSIDGIDNSLFEVTNNTYIAKNDEELYEFIDAANDEVNQEFLRLRMSSPLYGGNSDSLYARISSLHFDWYPLLWEVVNNNKNITDVTVIKDNSTFGGQYKPYVVDGQAVEEMPREDFLCLSSSACLEMYKSKFGIVNAANEKLVEGKTLCEAYKGCRPRYARGFMQKDIQEGAVDFDLENIFASSKKSLKEDVEEVEYDYDEADLWGDDFDVASPEEVEKTFGVKVKNKPFENDSDWVKPEWLVGKIPVLHSIGRIHHLLTWFDTEEEAEEFCEENEWEYKDDNDFVWELDIYPKIEDKNDAERFYYGVLGNPRPGSVAVTKKKSVGEAMNIGDIWCGSADIMDGHIEETHTYEEAEDNDFHHSLYFSPNVAEKITDGDSVFFFIDDGEIVLDPIGRGDDDIKNERFLINRIKKQLEGKLNEAVSPVDQSHQRRKKQFTTNAFKTLFQKFYKQGKFARISNWSVGRGGYDLDYEVYFRDIPVVRKMVDEEPTIINHDVLDAINMTEEELLNYIKSADGFRRSYSESKSYVEQYCIQADKFNGINEAVSPEGYAPIKTGKAYKVFKVKNGKLYPPMVANKGGEDTPIGVWLDAEEGEFAGLSKTGRPQVKSTQSGTLSYRPGWHLGDVPRAKQFDRYNKETGEYEFPKDFVWAECDYAMDIDYQTESDARGYERTKVDKDGNIITYKSNKYQHSLAGLPKLPTHGYYKYRTNPNPDTVPWVITGQMKVNRLLSDDEVNEILKSKGIEPIHRQGGDKTLAELGL